MKTVDPDHEQQTVHTDRQLVAGRYRLRARIGHGRIGEIYEAEDESYLEFGARRSVAIQLLPDTISLNNALFNKLQLGYAVIRTASHPNIVSYFEIARDGKFGYLVMDCLDGASLRTIIDDATTLPLDEVNPVIRAVGDALKFLHAKSIVHGQLTAESVFITDNLDVRLLDVVPLDSASTTLRSVASSDPFSRCDIGDDVYGLGCLAYEMLAGKHPFNFHAPTDARHAGIKPARIDSLPEKQWNAIRRALSFNREQRNPSVVDFLLDFGITGTERLRPSDHTTMESASPSSFIETDARPSANPAPGVGASNQLASDDRVDPPIRRIINPDTARAKRKDANRMPSPILLVALVGLGIWFVYGQPRNDLVTLTDYVDAYLNDGFTGSGNGNLPINVSDPTPVQTVAEDNAGAETTGESPVAGSAASSDAPLSQPANPIAANASLVTSGMTDEAATLPADEQLEDSTVGATRLNDNAEADVPASTANVAGASPSESEFTLIQSFVTISERDGVARIIARRPGNPADRVFWWTGDQTAIAGKDYIPIELPVEGFTSGEIFETLRIPLINDSLPEPQETFFVFLGRHNAKLGRLEPILRVRVQISDDE